MKEIKLSFNLSIVLNQTDIHWVEKLLKMREEVFLRILEKVLSEIESEASKKTVTCKRCGSVLVRNGRDKGR